MHRRVLLQLLQTYRPFDEAERASLERMRAFLSDAPDCFERHNAYGHFTGAGWLLSRDGRRVLLHQHRKLGMWLQLGGHADGDPDLLRVALREAREESGIEGIEPVHAGVFDVDVHEIPARGERPTHLHFDVRFLLRVTGEEIFQRSEESFSLAWLTSEEVEALGVDESVRRMNRKWAAGEWGIRNAE